MAKASNSTSEGPVERWREVRAIVGWWVRSWLHPAGDSLNWEQSVGRTTQHGTGLSTRHGQSPQSGGDAGSNRQQNVKETGAGT